jgi:hypothetical protein
MYREREREKGGRKESLQENVLGSQKYFIDLGEKVYYKGNLSARENKVCVDSICT